MGSMRPGDVRYLNDLPVPMRDGVALIADHYTPAGIETGPAVLIRTPYGRGGPGRSLS